MYWSENHQIYTRCSLIITAVNAPINVPWRFWMAARRMQMYRSIFAKYRYLGRPTQMSSVISGVTQQKFTKFLHDVATSSPLLMRPFKQWYCNSFSSDSAKNASGISQRAWHFTKINWLPWQSPSTNRKTRYRSIICTQSAFIWWKDCKNWSSISWDIRLNMPVFWPCRTKSSKCFLWSYRTI